MALCPLCQVREGVCKSHILSNFLYRDAYDEAHSVIVFEQEKQRRGTLFSGYWQKKLFCRECEEHVGRWESYFADIWFHNPLRPRTLEEGELCIRGLDYARFKLFHLSILWRASLCTLPQLAHVTLGSHHNDRIRDLLLRDDPGGADTYPIAGRALRDDDGSFKDDLLALPAVDRIDGHPVYRMLYGGVFWYCAVSSHRAACPVPAALQPDGTLRLIVQQWTRDPAVLALASDVRRFDERVRRAK